MNPDYFSGIVSIGDPESIPSSHDNPQCKFSIKLAIEPSSFNPEECETIYREKLKDNTLRMVGVEFICDRCNMVFKERTELTNYQCFICLLYYDECPKCLGKVASCPWKCSVSSGPQ